MNRIMFNPKILDKYFSDFVRFLCHSCKRYNTKHTCPPKVQPVEFYKKILPAFDHGILIYKRFEFDKSELSNWEQIGKESSLIIHNELIKLQHWIEAKEQVILLGAGSCKICSKCDYKCRFPDKAIMPLEATGINVMQLFKDLTGIELKFPVEYYRYFYRIGMILYI